MSHEGAWARRFMAPEPILKASGSQKVEPGLRRPQLAISLSTASKNEKCTEGPAHSSETLYKDPDCSIQ